MARRLMDKGFTLVRPLLGGFDEWVSKGFPLVERDLAAREIKN
jgi:rhodanese-related sulfurtransferase